MTRPTDEIDSRIDMERILAALPPQQRRAVDLYARGYTLQEIADKFGISNQAISKSFRNIVGKHPELLPLLLMEEDDEPTTALRLWQDDSWC